MKIPDKHLEVIKKLQAHIPADWVKDYENVFLSEYDRKLSGLGKIGEKVREEDYQKGANMQVLILTKINHEERMKGEYKRRGINGIVEYLRQYNKGITVEVVKRAFR